MSSKLKGNILCRNMFSKLKNKFIKYYNVVSYPVLYDYLTYGVGSLLQDSEFYNIVWFIEKYSVIPVE